MARTDHTGKKFNRLTAKRKTGEYYMCACDCGGKALVRSDHLASGHTKSCGCLKREAMQVAEAKKLRQAQERDALKKAKDAAIPRMRNCWRNMILRCTDTKDADFHRYGGRGIKVCDRWLASFDNFYADMRRYYTSTKTIDRKNNDGDYAPENCRWTSPQKQAWNRENNLLLIYNIGMTAKTIPLARVVYEHGLKYNDAYTAYYRIKKKLPEGCRPYRDELLLDLALKTP
jgi:hypothetical protein